MTNKRVDRTKIPNWKSLCSFLEKNEHVYIDPCSNELIRSRYGRNIPDIIRNRMINSNKSSTPNNSKPTTSKQQQSSSSPAPAKSNLGAQTSSQQASPMGAGSISKGLYLFKYILEINKVVLN